MCRKEKGRREKRETILVSLAISSTLLDEKEKRGTEVGVVQNEGKGEIRMDMWDFLLMAE